MAFVVLRIYLLVLARPVYSDVGLYFDYAVRGVDLQQAVYTDFQIEYPPLAWHVIALPRLLGGEAVTERQLQYPEGLNAAYAAYAQSFRFLMFLFDLGAFLRQLALDGFAGTVCNEVHPDALEFQNDAALRRHLKDCVACCREHLGHASQVRLEG